MRTDLFLEEREIMLMSKTHICTEWGFLLPLSLLNVYSNISDSEIEYFQKKSAHRSTHTHFMVGLLGEEELERDLRNDI